MVASTILTLALAPMRVAPAAAIFFTSSSVRIPPEAFTPISGPTVMRINSTSCAVAPDGPNPVDVFTKSALAILASMHAITFWLSSRSAVSRITFTIAPAAMRHVHHRRDVSLHRVMIAAAQRANVLHHIDLLRAHSQALLRFPRL